MVIQEQQQIEIQYYGGISRGMNLSNNQFSLEPNQSPYLVNVDLSRKGIVARKGYELRYQFPSWMNIISKHDFVDDKGVYWWICVSYPNIVVVDPRNFSWRVIWRKWYSDGGRPEADQSPNIMLLVDGVNKPLKIQRDTTTGLITAAQLAWPQTLANANDANPGAGAIGNIYNSAFNQGTVQQPADAGVPNHVLYLHNRFQLTDTTYKKRIWFSRITDVTDFSTNTPAAWDIAFFIDITTNYPVTGWRVLNNDQVIIYLSHGYAVQEGYNPPGAGYAEPRMSWMVRNKTNGLHHQNLLTTNGEGDHFFFSDNGRLYTLESSDNFNQAKPRGYSNDIYPIFELFDRDMWDRSIILNDMIKGELRLFCPTDDDDGYATRCMIYRYTEAQEEEGWTQEANWGDTFAFSTAFIDRETRQVYVVNKGNRLLAANTGTNFDGKAVQMICEIRPENFGSVAHEKEILGVVTVATSYTGAQFEYQHRWEDNLESTETIRVSDSTSIAEIEDYATLDYNIISDIGTDFSYTFTPIKHRNGVVLRQRIEASAEQNLIIYLLAIVYRKNNLRAKARVKPS